MTGIVVAIEGGGGLLWDQDVDHTDKKLDYPQIQCPPCFRRQLFRTIHHEQRVS